MYFLHKYPWLPFALFFVSLTCWAGGNAFFWDTIILSSAPAQWYIGGKGFFLPDALDTGHPPLWGLYLSLCWRTLGRTLLVSHLVVLPFLLGLVWQLYRLAQRFFRPQHVLAALAFPLTLAPLLGHSVLVSSDVALWCLMVAAVNAILENKQAVLVLCIFFLGLVSLRGAGIAVALWLWQFSAAPSPKKFLPVLAPYLLGGSGLLAYLIAHHIAKGWVFSHDGSPWASQRGIVTAAGLAKNIAVFGYGTVAFGVAGMWVIWAGAFNNKPLYASPLPRLAICLFAVSALMFLPFNNPVSPRYLIAGCIVLALAVAFLLFETDVFARARPYLCALVLACNLSEHFWLLPEPRANAWDCTLAHTPYYRLRANMLHDLDAAGIPVESVGTTFPCAAPFTLTDLSSRLGHFPEKELPRQRYVLYSNLFNEFTDNERETLLATWREKMHWESGAVRLLLYERRVGSGHPYEASLERAQCAGEAVTPLVMAAAPLYPPRFLRWKTSVQAPRCAGQCPRR